MYSRGDSYILNVLLKFDDQALHSSAEEVFERHADEIATVSADTEYTFLFTDMLLSELERDISLSPSRERLQRLREKVEKKCLFQHREVSGRASADCGVACMIRYLPAFHGSGGSILVRKEAYEMLRRGSVDPLGVSGLYDAICR